MKKNSTKIESIYTSFTHSIPWYKLTTAFSIAFLAIVILLSACDSDDVGDNIYTKKGRDRWAVYFKTT